MSDIPETGLCYQCSTELDDNYYCFGCKEFICDREECGSKYWSMADTMHNAHVPEDHFIEADDGESDYEGM